MSAPASRRGFLRGLTTLPLIGGSVVLIGSPVRAAQPITPGMLATYSAWLHMEQRAIQCSVGINEGTFIPCVNPGAHFHFDHYNKERFGLEAQLRAPTVLAAVGCPLTSAEAEEAWATTFRPLVREGGR
ncbi:hypothetical protein MKK69_04660 [Methylobacterium sp. J-026]|uniref:hypothetical protein n=1 Tax=Methylobacterium sp. J-026 TaxID=2836624 RepID=UPI001FBBFF30|nr:hypothetical protein [Methylobacterium sp. J-026]MCJ2133359.1 hypothetical protein [Methylobacterium sp. J-026]